MRRTPRRAAAHGCWRLARGCWFAALLAGLAPIAGTVARGAGGPESAGIEYFEKSVRPLLVKHCYECHSTREANGGLVLDTRAGALKGGDSGVAIVPGKPNQSRLVEAIRYGNPDLKMPPKNRLKPAEVDALEKWIAMGAPDPRQADEAGSAPAPVGMSIEKGRAFWSLRPVTNPAVPEVRHRAWVRTPVDAFVLAKLEASGLQPAPRADKRTLIRRLTFDLIGLPPTPSEVVAFLADETPDAYEKIVERLLQSPGYGVRWGRHWLDVARYADSNGLDENLAFGNAWRYRDYVVDSFNRDKPFDRFLIEQLAGDLLPNANRETKTATGFLVLGAKVLAEPDREKLEADTIDEQIDTIGKAFLGMTVGCARCHDHKFDPLKQTDYCALAAIFKSTKTFGDTNFGAIKHWHEHSFASIEELAKLAAIDKQIADKKAAATTFKNAATQKLRAEAQAKATEYLMTAARFDLNTPLSQIEALAKPLGLHARILHHCRRHLDFHRDDRLFARWHELAAAGDIAGIERHYRTLFTKADAAFVAARKANPKAAKCDDPQLELARAALHDPSGFLVVPPKPEFAFDSATLAEYHRLAEEARILESNAPDAHEAMGVVDAKIAAEMPIHIRGSHRNLGKAVARGFPEVMRTSGVGPALKANQSGRLELAHWMADGRHPLTARVFVNRVWRWHFGAGIVSSTENFGSLGDRPSHPELLDWLARQFVAGGWSIKALHRTILASSTYQMASANSDESAASRVDPANRLLWKIRLQRLEAEQIRDAILAVSGRLDESMGGKSIPLRNRQFVFDHTSIDHTKYGSLRRALYLPVIRNNLYTLFEQFDFPDPTMPTGNRNATVVAPQALLLMNSELVMDSADEMARKLLEQSGDDAARIRSAYERAFGRPPNEAETRRVSYFLRDGTGSPAADPMARRKAWALFCHSLFASNEFIYVR